MGFYELVGKLMPVRGRGNVSRTYHGQAGLFVKEDDDPPLNYVANEHICAELANLIRLPVPPHFCAIVKRTNRKVFCSLDASLAGAALPPIVPEIAVQEQPDLCTGVLIFDIWIGNDDRHLGNIAYQRERPPHKLTIFDHSHAPFFHPDFIPRTQWQLGVIRDDGMRHCLLDVLNTADYIDKWIARIERVPDEFIREIVSEATQLGLPSLIERMGYYHLRDRRNYLREMIRQQRDQFRGISQWGLL